MRIYRTVWLDPMDLIVRFRYFYRRADLVRFTDRITTDREFPVRRNQIQHQVLDQKTGEWTSL
jgi:hypothetical protein